MVTISEALPSVDDYLRLRREAGLSARSREAVERGLSRSLFCVIARDDNRSVGMARVVGDGGCNYEIVDVAASPEYQGQGIGRHLMAAIMAFLDKDAVLGCYICLIADVPDLYEKFGFKKTAPGAEGMYLRK